VVFLCHEYACSQTGQPVFSLILFFFCLFGFIHIFVSSRWSDWNKNYCHLISLETKIFQYLNIMNKCSAFAVLRIEINFWEGFSFPYFSSGSFALSRTLFNTQNFASVFLRLMPLLAHYYI